MAVIYDLTMKTARMNATREQVASGTIELLAANDTVLAEFELTATAGSVAGSLWTLQVDPVAAIGLLNGVATKAQIRDSLGVARITGLVVGDDVIISNPNIAIGQDITFVSGTINHAVDPV